MTDETEQNENVEPGVDEPLATGDEPGVVQDAPADRPPDEPAMVDPVMVDPATEPRAETAVADDETDPVGESMVEPTVEPAAGPTVQPTTEPAEEPMAQAVAEVVDQSVPQGAVEPSEPEPSEPTGEEAEPEPGDQEENVDDVAAAVAAASENVQGESTFDDIAPGTVAAEGAAAVEVVHERSANAVSIWPFVVYDLFWAAFAGLLIWQFQTLPTGTPVYEAELYPTALLAGVILVAAGPLLILVSWIASWGKPGSTKGRLFISALVKGSVATLLGVTMWWAALMVLDQIRLGTPL